MDGAWIFSGVGAARKCAYKLTIKQFKNIFTDHTSVVDLYIEQEVLGRTIRLLSFDATRTA
jgi:hypothetical protein